MGCFTHKEKYKKSISKYYDTPKQLDIKWQIGVKFVPENCYFGKDNQNFFNIP